MTATPENELRTYWGVLWRHKWLILISTVAAGLVVILYLAQLPPAYSSGATLRVSSASIGLAQSSDISYVTLLKNTLVEIITGKPMTERVFVDVEHPVDPRISVQVLPETELVVVTVTHEEPEVAQHTLEKLTMYLVSEGANLITGMELVSVKLLDEQLTQAEQELQATLRAYQESAVDPATSEQELAILRDAVIAQRGIRDGIKQQVHYATLSEAQRANAISVVEQAGYPEKSSDPNRLLYIVIGSIAGLGAGFLLAFLLNSLDHSLRSVQSLEREAQGVRIMIPIPSAGRSLRFWRAQPAFPPSPYSAYADALHQLWVSLVLALNAGHSSSLLITSPGIGEGKTTLTANLALLAAAQGYRILLIDIDMRRPKIHEFFGLKPKSGLADVLAGHIQLEHVIVPTNHPGLSVLPSTAADRRCVEHLPVNRAKVLLEKLSSQYDLLLIDSPCFLGVSDTTAMASHVNKVLLLVDVRQTTHAQFAATIKYMHNLKIDLIGVVPNQVSSNEIHPYYPPKLHSSKLSQEESPRVRARHQDLLDTLEKSAASAASPSNQAKPGNDGQIGQNNDLKRIKGIGKKREQLLREYLHVTSFQELARQSTHNIRDLLREQHHIFKPTMIDEWITEAERLAKYDDCDQDT